VNPFVVIADADGIDNREGFPPSGDSSVGKVVFLIAVRGVNFPSVETDGVIIENVPNHHDLVAFPLLMQVFAPSQVPRMRCWFVDVTYNENSRHVRP